MLLRRKLTWMWIPSLWKSMLSNSELPNARVQVVFRLRYPKARSIAWKQIDVFKWQATFKVKGVAHWSLYGSEGDWLETIRKFDFNDLPKRIQHNYGLTYTTKGLQNIYRVQTPLRTFFEIQMENGIYVLKLLYDEKGKVIGKMMG